MALQAVTAAITFSPVAILFIGRICVALVFVAAGIGKLFGWTGVRASLRDFGLPERLLGPVAYALPLIELGCAGLLVVRSTARIGAAAAGVLLLAFTAAVVRVLARGEQPECNCFGALRSTPVSWRTVARNAVLLVAATLLLAVGPGHAPEVSLSGSDALILGVGAGLLVLIAAHAFFSLQLFRQNGRLLERVRALEETAADRPHSRAPAPGLPIGTPAPSFELGDLNGVPRTLEELLAPGRQLALAFSEPDCGACSTLPALLARLQAARDGELDVALISRGSSEENGAKLGAGRLSTVLLQAEREVALQFGVASVPSALTIAPDGSVSSALAVGPAAIEKLLGTPANENSRTLPSVGVAP